MPVIAVGRLGDPAIATAAVESGKADFIALGRTLVADPRMGQQAARAASRSAAASPATPASTTCAAAPASPASSTARPAARAVFATPHAAAGRAHRGDRRRPGRPDLRVAGRRRQHGHRVRERRSPGGAFRYAGQAPMFQEVGANPARSSATSTTWCGLRAARASPSASTPTCTRAASCSRRSIASWWRPARAIASASAPVAMGLLDLGAGALAGIAAAHVVAARCATGSITARGSRPASASRALAKPGQIVIVIGDAPSRQEQGRDRQRLRGGAAVVMSPVTALRAHSPSKTGANALTAHPTLLQRR